MENIWYNKYLGNQIKTDKKIRQLKALMVQKLIFQPLIDYAQSRVNKVNTIDKWLKPNEIVTTKETKESNIEEKKEKPNHEITIKKLKQTKLSFCKN